MWTIETLCGCPYRASDDSAFDDGAEIKVDGGWLAARTRTGELAG